jgi:hypothetical protein
LNFLDPVLYVSVRELVWMAVRGAVSDIGKRGDLLLNKLIVRACFR